jgi:hypothetical protein
VRLQNLENRATAAGDIASQLRAAAQASIKSFSSRVSSTFGNTLNELAAAEHRAASTAQNGSLRQNLVAGVSNSRASLTSTAAAVPPIVNKSATQSTESGLQPLVDAADGTSTSTTGATSNPPSSSTPSAPAGAPKLYSPTQTLSTDPTVFTTQNYGEQLLYSSYLQQANNENNLRYQNYMNEYQNWQLNGSQGQPPAAPTYETIDQNAFGAWYAQMTTNYSQGANAPDVSMFMTNGPSYGNGYYGAVGTSQVGTLYNPTGPATPPQVTGAGGSPNSNVKNA